ncbi:MAG: methyltransferase domain-containing protein [Zoogloeaceae bacterium]|nr:methyltransferase domain-containing protein [Zoogloeaceae bacterium]MCK6384568.1 methyltransferase domain-containing protein [Rhodocyclaceae bacterium]
MSFDPDRFKREERTGYNLIAARYAESAALRAGLNAALIAAAELRPGQAVLDLASGPGVLAREAARAMPDGLVVASDIAEQALAEGRRRVPAGKLQFAAADAERLTFRDAAFDRVLCGLGLMFFPAVPRALAEMRRVLKPGGLAVFSVWGEETRAPLVSCALQCIRRILPPPKVERLSPFRYGEPALLRQTLEAAGFAGVELHVHVLSCAFDTSQAYWQAFRDLAGGAAAGLSRLPEAMLVRLGEEVAQELAPCRQGEGYVAQSEVLIARARRV